MKLVIIIGPPAVGKMTVGFELARLTGLKLFHNHMTIDLVLNFFDFGESQFYQLVAEFRRRIFEEVSASDLRGLIFTYVWAFDLEAEKEYIEKICNIFREKNAEIYFVELETDLAERIKRNETEFRLAQKVSKRNTEKSKINLLASENHKLNSDIGEEFFRDKDYLRINNTNLSAEETAQIIIDKFGFSKDNF